MPSAPDLCFQGEGLVWVLQSDQLVQDCAGMKEVPCRYGRLGDGEGEGEGEGTDRPHFKHFLVPYHVQVINFRISLSKQITKYPDMQN